VTEFVPAIPLVILREGRIEPANVRGRWLAFYLVDGVPHCTDDICSHQSNQLSDGGYLDGDEVQCAFHGGRFNIRTGAAIGLPATEPIRTFPVEVREGRIYVDIGDGSTASAPGLTG
jgi:nitrite reductase/ring-hydroxylating ferredoxin subunit